MIHVHLSSTLEHAVFSRNFEVLVLSAANIEYCYLSFDLE
jgi:hypothetical protein